MAIALRGFFMVIRYLITRLLPSSRCSGGLFWLGCVIAVPGLLGLSPAAGAEQARVAVAANFAAPIKAITAAFEKDSIHTIQLSIGSSGKLFAQIQNGAPYDVMLSADSTKPEKLVQSGLAVAESRFTYAIGRLVLWHTHNLQAKRLLETGNYSRLAIANPRLAPYGKAARETLKHLNLTDPDKIVSGENISQTYRFVASGNADLGFVALSQVIVDAQVPEGAWVVPKSMHSPIRQDAVILQHGKANAAAQALMDFLKSEQAISIIRQFGYDVDIEEP